MFLVTKIDSHTGNVVIEDQEMGLIFDFHMQDVVSATVVGEYDLELVDVYGNKKVVKILE